MNDYDFSFKYIPLTCYALFVIYTIKAHAEDKPIEWFVYWIALAILFRFIVDELRHLK